MSTPKPRPAAKLKTTPRESWHGKADRYTWIGYRNRYSSPHQPTWGRFFPSAALRWQYEGCTPTENCDILVESTAKSRKASLRRIVSASYNPAPKRKAGRAAQWGVWVPCKSRSEARRLREDALGAKDSLRLAVVHRSKP